MGKGTVGAIRRLCVVVCDPGRKPEVRSGDGDSLEVMQGFVGGNIEKLGAFPYMGTIVVDVYINEDGNALELEPNRLVRMPTPSGNANIYSIVGPIMLVAADESTGETLSLDAFEGLTDFALRLAKQWEVWK